MKYTTIHSHIGRTASKSEFQNCDGDDDDEQPSRQNHPLNKYRYIACALALAKIFHR